LAGRDLKSPDAPVRHGFCQGGPPVAVFVQGGPDPDYIEPASALAHHQLAMKRIFKLDAQGRKELLEATAESNARIREIEEESAERTGRELPPVALRHIVLPASEEQIAELRAEESRKRGNPPL
jgi:hypothetical protein